MRREKTKVRISSPVCGILCFLTYVGMALISWKYYPQNFSPEANWLSDLGHVIDNPDGAIFYRIGAVLPGILLICFFAFLPKVLITPSVEIWEYSYRKVALYTILTRVFGVIAGLAFVMTGIFPISNPAAHSPWSIIMYISFGTSIAFSGITWLYGGKKTLWLAVFAFLTAVFDIMSVIFDITIWEWVLAALLIIYVLLVSIMNLMWASRNNNDAVIENSRDAVYNISSTS